MGIRELIAAKQQGRLSFPVPDPVPEDIEMEEIEIEDFSYVKTSKDEIDKDLFLASYAPYIREPYKFDWFTHKDYYLFLLGDAAYTINLFPVLDIERILLLYLKYKTPKNLEEYTILCSLLNHLHLRVPREYQIDIESMIIE